MTRQDRSKTKAQLIEELEKLRQELKALAQANSPPPQDSDRNFAKISGEFSRRFSRVLVVDDSSIVRKSIKLELAKAGHQIEFAASGREALEKVKANPDLVLLDLHLPDMGGLEVLKKIRGVKPELPVIMLTAAADLESRIDAFNAGADDYLIKPYHSVELKTRIGRLLERARLQTELRRESLGRKAISEQLTRSESFHQALLENSTDITVVLDDQFRVKYQGASAEKLLGHAPEEMRGKSPLDLVHPEDLEKVAPTMKEILEHPDLLLTDVIRVKHRDGSYRHLKATGRNLLNDPVIAGIVVNVKDITLKEQAEVALKESEKKYRLLAENQNDGIWAMTLEGRFLYLSPSIEKITGFSVEEAKELGMVGLLTSDSFLQAKDRIEQELDLASQDRSKYMIMELDHRKKDGSLIPTEVSATWMLGEDDEPIGLQGITRDISERRLMLQRIRNEETFRKSIEDTIPSGLSMVDAEGRQTYVNPAFCRMLGFGPDELMGRMPPYAYWPPEELPAINRAFEKTIANQAPPDGWQLKFMRKDGTRFPVQVIISPLYQDGELKGWLGNTVDISEIKRAEEMIRKERDYLLSVFGAMEDGVYIAAKDFRVEYVNDSLRKIFGDPEGKRRYEYFQTRTGPCENCLMEDVISGESLHREWHSKTNNRVYDLIDSPFINPDGSVSKLTIFRDVTERKRYQSRIETLLQINQMSQASLKEIADYTLEKIVKDTDSGVGFIGFISDDEKTMTIHAWSNEAMAECRVQDKPMHFPIDRAGVWGEAVRRRKPFFLEDYSQDHPAKRGTPEGHVEVKNYLGVPIFSGDAIVAVAGLANKPAAYGEEDVHHVQALMGDMCRIVEMKRAENIIAIQRDLAIALSATSDLDEALKLCVDAAIESSGMDAGGVYLRDPQSGDLHLRYTRGLSEAFVSHTSDFKHDHPSAQLIMQGRPVFAAYSQLSRMVDDIRLKEGLRAIGVMPIVHEGQVIGSLNVASRSYDSIPLPARNILEIIVAQIGGVITRAWSKAELQSEHDLLQSLIDGAKNSHLVYLDRDFNFIRVNAAYAATCGYRPEEMIGRNHFELYPDPENEAIFRRVRDVGDPFIIHDKPFTFPDQPERGTTYWDWSLTPIKDAAGQSLGLVFSLFETTERVRAEKALRESEGLLSRSEEIGSIGSWKLEPAANRLTWSDETFRIFGFQPQEFTPTYKTFLKSVHPADREMVDRVYLNSIREGLETYDLEHRIVRNDTGEVRHVHERCIHERNASGVVVRSVGMVQDITQSKRMTDELTLTMNMLDMVRQAQSSYIGQEDPKQVFESLLDNLIKITESEYGFLDDVFYDAEGVPYKKNLALSNIAWDLESEKLYRQLQERNLEFRNLGNLAGLPAILKEPVIANDVASDSRTGGLPAGHPAIITYMGLPVFAGGKVVAIAGVANRAGGYDSKMAKFLEPYLNACAGIIEAMRLREQERQISAALVASEEHYRTILQTAMDGYWLCDLDARLIEVNDAYCRMSGYSREELLSMSIPDLEAREDHEENARHMRKVIEEGQDRFESSHRHKNGGLFQVEISVQYWPSDGGRVVAFIRDITDRKQAEEELLRSMQTSSDIVTAIPSGFFIYSYEPPDRLILENANPEAEKLTGILIDQWGGREFNEIWPNAFEAGITEHFLEVMRTGETFETEELYYTDERLSGAFRVRAFRLPGQRLAVAFEDVTERRRAEEALRESEEQHRALIEGIPDIVMSFDRDGRHLFVSDNVASVVDFPPAQFIGKTHRELGFPEDMCRFWEDKISRVFKENHPLETEFSFSGRQGPVLFNWRLIPERDRLGRIRSVLTIARDITQKKIAEEEILKTKRLLEQTSRMSGIGGWEKDFIVNYDHWSDITREIHEVGPDFMPTMDNALAFYKEGESREKIMAAVKRTMETGKPYDVEVQFITAKGRERWVRTMGNGRFQNGECVGIYGTIQDVTERRQMEESLKNYQEKLLLRNRISELFLTNPGDEVYKKLLDLILEKLGSPLGTFGYLNQNGDLVQASLTGEVWDQCQVDQKNIVFPRSIWAQNVWAKPLLESRAVFFNHLFEVPAGHLPIERMMLVPIIHGDEIIGSISVANKSCDYDDDDLSLLQDIAGSVSPVLNGRLKRKLAEEEVRRERDRAQGYLDTVEAIIVALDLEGKIVSLNRMGCRLLGYGEEELVGKNWFETCLPQPSGMKEIYPIFGKMVRGEIEQLEYFENPVVTVKGEVREVAWHNSMLRDGNGKILGTLSAGEDITERRRMEEELRHSEKRFRELVNASPSGVWVVQDGKMAFVNATALKMFGYEESEFLGQDALSFHHPDYHHVILERIGNVLSGSSNSSQEVILLNKSGEKIIFEGSSSPIDFNDRPAVLVVGQDVTREKMYEEERIKSQRLESIGILAGGIAHDFNNLLMSIIGNLEVAGLDLEAGEDPAESLLSAEQAADRAAEITKQLLTFSRGGAPVVGIESLQKIITEAVGFVRHGSNVRCRLDLAPDLLPVLVDAGQISQVVNNLVINAIQAMPKGGKVDVTAGNTLLEEPNPLELPGGQYVCFSVADHGNGIPPEILPKIFDPYFTTKEKGSGLGLASVYSIISRHHGKITVETEVGKGTIFKVYLPAKSVALRSEPKPLARIRKGQGTILLMDDEIEVRRAARRMLERMGFKVEEAEDGLETIEKYRAAMAKGRPYSVVIFDLTIPGGMGGGEAIRQIRELAPTVKAIVASGYSEDPVLAHYREFGFSGMVVKPYKMDKLSRVLFSVLSHDDES